jgi:arsenical pump membrane protein
VSKRVNQPPLAGSGRIVAIAIALTAITLLIASTAGWQLGLPTFLAGAGAGIGVSAIKREAPWPVLKKVSWTVLPLVAGLSVLVQGVESTGILARLIGVLSASAQQSPHGTALLAGSGVAFACNAINNLPMGLLAGTVAHGAHLPAQVTGALLIGLDLGPNLSVTGSLATILWLVAIRREGQDVSAWKFLAVGSLVMPIPLLASLGSFLGLEGLEPSTASPPPHITQRS